ncbi:hypothetical protein [Leptospira yasudae]|nr:hypothetical protein [Leptospira yasudae]
MKRIELPLFIVFLWYYPNVTLGQKILSEEFLDAPRLKNVSNRPKCLR